MKSHKKVWISGSVKLRSQGGRTSTITYLMAELPNSCNLENSFFFAQSADLRGATKTKQKFLFSDFWSRELRSQEGVLHLTEFGSSDPSLVTLITGFMDLVLQTMFYKISTNLRTLLHRHDLARARIFLLSRTKHTMF